MSTRVRTIYVMKAAEREQDTTRPQVWIDSTKGQEVTFGVKATGRTLREAREKAIAEFRMLAKEVDDMKSDRLAAQMNHGRP